MIRSIALASVLVLALAAPSCVTLMPASGLTKGRDADAKLAANICEVFKGITYDGRVDSLPTKEQIRQHNAKITAYCNNPKETKQ